MIWPNWNRHVLAVIYLKWPVINAMPALELGLKRKNIFSKETSFMFHIMFVSTHTSQKGLLKFLGENGHEQKMVNYAIRNCTTEQRSISSNLFISLSWKSQIKNILSVYFFSIWYKSKFWFRFPCTNKQLCSQIRWGRLCFEHLFTIGASMVNKFCCKNIFIVSI